MRVIKLGLALALAVGLVACQKAAKGPGNVDGARIAAADTNGEWVSYGKGYSEQRYSPLDKINASNVGQLGLAWYAQFDTDRGQEATPLMVDGVLYTTTAWSKVYAFDAASGKLLWSYDPKVDGRKGFDACCDVVNRGVAVWKGKVYVGALDGRLIALDAKDGHVVWSVQTTDPAKPFTITQAPRVVKDKVLIGNSGAEYGVRGYITAYDAATGKKAWRFYTIPSPDGKPDGEPSDKVLKDKAAVTWPEGKWKLVGGGGTVWDAIAYDPALDMIYFGVDNGTPWNQEERSGGKGDNLFVSSIVAVKADTGEYVWHYQVNPGESWDYSAVQQITLADLNIGGQPRKVLMQAPKNGFFYVIDRTNGQLISAKPYVPVTWAKEIDIKTGRPVENPAARYKDGPELQMPAPLGAHNWHPMAYSPKTNLVYIPAQSMPFAYAADPNFVYKPGGWNLGVNLLANAGNMTPEQAKQFAANLKGALIAWDPVNQKPAWSVQHPYFWNAGILATPGLVFQGAAEGQFYAYDAANGKQLWSYPTGNGVIAAPMTYELNGEQYVALMVGAGGGGQVSAPSLLPTRPRLPGRLLVFKLGAKAQAPEFKIAQLPPLDLTGVTTTGDKSHGYVVFNNNCQVCHGANATGSWLPDLKRSPMITTADNFNSVVIQGVRAHNGMVSFSRFLKPQDVEDVRAFLISQAKGEPLPIPAAGAKTAAGAK
ncbi:PQQ-dependent dehydrogenase, methanol/ethanol family [Phenylobacterium soli]|uniref:PQQ-dependent dehydrogenase, methanol/ethanol family n=1 Tax=Phenylobacterium soli TaxID=2170551 RepID=A0A328AEQ7_9CAUL|nr:PQQ-dependent dehydrogenase, methanol/ethanol family [Phenylobacterium soli]RAK53180.1 PQQ-dependent dehydrogenase, methanol/ethanol family [Phenylobacterium soli]